MEPTRKSPGVEKLLDDLAPHGRTKSIKSNTCAMCGEAVTEFRDDKSLTEYGISGVCQKCQDEFFGT